MKEIILLVAGCLLFLVGFAMLAENIKYERKITLSSAAFALIASVGVIMLFIFRNITEM